MDHTFVSLEFSQDPALLDIEKNNFSHFMVNWSFNVSELALEALLLSRVSPEHLYYFH